MIRHSGIGTYLENIIPQLVTMNKHVQFSIIGDKKLLTEIIGNRENVHIIHTQIPIYSLAEQIRLPRLIPKNTDVYWSPHYNIPIFYRGKLAVTVHDVFHLRMKEYVGFFKRMYAKIMFFCIKVKAKRINTNSFFTKSEITNYVGIDADKIKVTALGVDEMWRRPVSPPLLSEPYIIFIGNVKPNKNLITLLKSFEILMDDISHYLIIAGKKDGFIINDIDSQDYSEKLGKRIRFLGHVPKNDLINYVKHSALLVFPSIYEGFGLPPIEAMACGCPVIAARSSSIPEVCGDAVLYFDPKDERELAVQIKTVLQNNEIREMLIKKGKDRSCKYSWEQCAKEISQMLNEVFAK
jgi:glycosyltransferase involved in cell wall biosynthesis